MALISPSLLAADFARLGEALRMMQEAGATMVHVDVMDGHFVPEVSVGQPVIKSLRKATGLALDVHLMIERPERFVKEFAELGAERIAIHAEATPNLHHALKLIRDAGAQVGLALNPATAVETQVDALRAIDYLLVLSADMGFAGAKYLPGTVAKIQAACKLRSESRLSFVIEVEGGIDEEQIEALGQAGADILVAGPAIFKKEPKTRLVRMMLLAEAARQVSRT